MMIEIYSAVRHVRGVMKVRGRRDRRNGSIIHHTSAGGSSLAFEEQLMAHFCRNRGDPTASEKQYLP